MLSPARTKWEKGVKQYALELANEVGVFCALDLQARAVKEACDLVMKLAKRS